MSKRLTPQILFKIVLKALCTDEEYIRSPTRKWEAAAVRQVIIVLLYEHFEKPPLKTSASLINRTHSVIIRLYRTGCDRISVNDPIISPKYRTAKKAVEEWTQLSK